MTYFSDEILICLIALGLIGAALALRILVLLRGPGVIESSQLIKKSIEITPKKDLEAKLESLDLPIYKSNPLECHRDNLRTEKDLEIKKLNDRIDKLEMVQETVQEKNFTISKLESEIDMFRGGKEAEINGLRDIITRLQHFQEERISEMETLKKDLKNAGGENC